MAKNVKDILKSLPPAQRKKVEARAAQLIAEEMTLQELRRARKLSQVRVAKTLGVGQESVSRIEKRADLMISTLRKTVEAMGGSLCLVAQFPDRDPVVLSGIAEGVSTTAHRVERDPPLRYATKVTTTRRVAASPSSTYAHGSRLVKKSS